MRGPEQQPLVRAHGSRDNRGLTLLEVLAAFLIFGMVFTVLVGSSQTAVYSQGLAHRRLEANLIADEVLTDLEAQMQQRIKPILAEGYARDPYEIEVTESLFGGALGNEPELALAGPQQALEGASDVMALLVLELPEVAKYLLRYDVVVRWPEDDGLQEVSRTTFAFDWETASFELAALAPESEDGLGAGASAEGGGDASDRRGDETQGGRSRERDRRERGAPSQPPSGSEELTVEEMRRMLGL